MTHLLEDAAVVGVPPIRGLALDAVFPYRMHSEVEVRKLVSEGDPVGLAGSTGVRNFGLVCHFAELEADFAERTTGEEK